MNLSVEMVALLGLSRIGQLMSEPEMRVVSVAAPVRQQVAASFRSAILSGRFKPGDRLGEKELCELTGASRTSVREALRQLETEGLVQVVPNKGPIVAVMTDEQARNIYEVREALEALATSLFVERASPEERQKLREALVAVTIAYGSNEVQAILAAKDLFYSAIFLGAHNDIISETLKTMHARVSLLRRVSLSSPERAALSLAEIQAIAKAIDEGDAEAAARACREHIRNAAKAALGHLAE